MISLFLQVTMANKRHGTAPHAMFAIDEIVLCGVRSILVIVSPGELLTNSLTLLVA